MRNFVAADFCARIDAASRDLNARHFMRDFSLLGESPPPDLQQEVLRLREA